MAWAYRSSSYANDGTGFNALPSGGTDTVTVGTALSAGDLIVLGITALDANGGANPTFAVSDSVNGSWGSAQVVTRAWTVATFPTRTSVWVFPNTGSGTPVITVTFTGTGAPLMSGGLQVAAFSGMATSSAFDTGASATGATANPSSGAVSPATGAASELMIGMYFDQGENTTLSVGNINGVGATLAQPVTACKLFFSLSEHCKISISRKAQ